MERPQDTRFTAAQVDVTATPATAIGDGHEQPPGTLSQQSPEEFYQELVKRPDVRAILTRLANL